MQFPGRTFIGWFSGGKFSRCDGGDDWRNPARRWSSRKRNGRNVESVTERANETSDRNRGGGRLTEGEDEGSKERNIRGGRREERERERGNGPNESMNGARESEVPRTSPFS